MLASRRRLYFTLLVSALAACGDDGSDGASDSPADPDASVRDAAPPDGSAPDSGGLATTCTGTCAATRLTATFDGTTRVLNAAYYGLTKTATETTIRVEAYQRATAPGCPEEGGSADQTLILVAIPIPTTTATTTTVATLLDLEGALLETISARADTVALVPVAANVCADCVGMPAPSDPDGVLALDADLTFPTGTITGHLFATHCDSLDLEE